MRVDWCVSSWFRIKNTHSLTLCDAKVICAVLLPPLVWRVCFLSFFLLKSLCGGGVPSSHPSLGFTVFFLSFFLGDPALVAEGPAGPRAFQFVRVEDCGGASSQQALRV